MGDRFKYFGDRVRTGDINEDCLGCKYAAVIEGENVQFPIMFCLKFMDFPIKRKVVKVLRQPLAWVEIERKTCRGSEIDFHSRIRPVSP